MTKDNFLTSCQIVNAHLKERKEKLLRIFNLKIEKTKVKREYS